MSEKKEPIAQSKKPSEKKADPVLYVGPTIRGVAAYGTVYSQIPEAAKKASADAPQFLNLFIQVKEYGAALEMIRNKRGYIYEADKEAREKLQ